MPVRIARGMEDFRKKPETTPDSSLTGQANGEATASGERASVRSSGRRSKGDYSAETVSHSAAVPV